MPLVRIDVLTVFSSEERRQIGECVQLALTRTLDVPRRDRFQVITAHDAADFDFDRGYLDIERTDRFVLVHVTLAAGRTVGAKQGFYRQLAGLLAERIGLRREDLAVILSENDRHDWSFGNGDASYVVIPREQWR